MKVLSNIYSLVNLIILIINYKNQLNYFKEINLQRERCELSCLFMKGRRTNRRWNVFSWICILSSNEWFLHLFEHNSKCSMAIVLKYFKANSNSFVSIRFQWNLKKGMNLIQTLMSIKWNSLLAEDWQEFYQNSNWITSFGRSLQMQTKFFDKLPHYWKKRNYFFHRRSIRKKTKYFKCNRCPESMQNTNDHNTSLTMRKSFSFVLT